MTVQSPLSVFNGNTTLTMSSHEVADLTQSRHDSVMRTVERLAQAGAISLPPLVEVKIQRERRVETATGYHLDKRATILVVGRLNVQFMARVFDRWEELEAKQAPDAAELARVQAELLALQREKFEANAVWVAIADLRAAGRDGAFIAKVMGLTRFQQEHAVKAIRRAGLGHFLPAPAVAPVGGRRLATDARQLNLGV